MAMRNRIAPALVRICVTLPATLAALGAGIAPPAPTAPAAAVAGSLDASAAARFAALALKCLHQEYPNHISHTLNGDSDARPPRELTPRRTRRFDVARKKAHS